MESTSILTMVHPSNFYIHLDIEGIIALCVTCKFLNTSLNAFPTSHLLHTKFNLTNKLPCFISNYDMVYMSMRSFKHLKAHKILKLAATQLNLEVLRECVDKNDFDLFEVCGTAIKSSSKSPIIDGCVRYLFDEIELLEREWVPGMLSVSYTCGNDAVADYLETIIDPDIYADDIDYYFQDIIEGDMIDRFRDAVEGRGMLAEHIAPYMRIACIYGNRRCLNYFLERGCTIEDMMEGYHPTELVIFVESCITYGYLDVLMIVEFELTIACGRSAVYDRYIECTDIHEQCEIKEYLLALVQRDKDNGTYV